MKTDYKSCLMLSESEYAMALSDWFFRRTGLHLNLRNPKTFNEKIQWLKLYDPSPLKTLTADKYLVRDWVKNKIGEHYLIPLLGVYNSFSEINFDDLPSSFVLKASHGSGWNCVVRNKKTENLVEMKRKFDFWMHRDYAFQYGFELHYRNIKPRIVVEKYIENKAGNLYDYKIWCFNGEPKYISFYTDRSTELKMLFFDTNWNRQNFTTDHEMYTGYVEKPHNLSEMLSIAKLLARDFYHVCVDLYRLDDGTIYFGELTHTRASGAIKWHPAKWNLWMGKLLILPKDKDTIMNRFDYILPESSGEIRWKYYRYALLSMFTCGKKRQHYTIKRNEYHGKLFCEG